MRFSPLSVLFLLTPLAEIVTFGLVVEWLGFWRALALVMLTSLAGLLIVRHQGFGLVSKVSGMAREGRMPLTGVGSDLLIMLAGLLLLLPGFLTDIAGLLLLIPFVRRRLSRLPASSTRVYTATTYTETYDFGGPARQTGSETVVDLDEDDYRRTGNAADPDRKRLDGNGQ